MRKCGEGKGWERGGERRGRERGERREGGKRRGSSHAFCFLNLGSSVVAMPPKMFVNDKNVNDNYAYSMVTRT